MNPEPGHPTPDWHEKRIPPATPVPDALWEILRSELPRKLGDRVPLLRRDLEGCESDAINADTELILLSMIAVQGRNWKQGEEAKLILNEFINSRAAQIDALEKSALMIGEQMPVLIEAIRLAQAAEERTIKQIEKLWHRVIEQREDVTADMARMLAAFETRAASQAVTHAEQIDRIHQGHLDTNGKILKQLAAERMISKGQIEQTGQAAQEGIGFANHSARAMERAAFAWRRAAYVAFAGFAAVILIAGVLLAWMGTKLLAEPSVGTSVSADRRGVVSNILKGK